MTEEDVAELKQHPYFDDIIKVRHWDEEAKSYDAVLLPLSHFKNWQMII